MGALIESPGVTAHLDPVATLHLEKRVRIAIEEQILRWIAEHHLQDRPPVATCVDRFVADPAALVRMSDWVEQTRWFEVKSYVG
ncbi:MAG: hypothetical protein IPP23_03355 [Sphingomonadales bacterium]|nr:hypothetical protein [Sphingomonadales bacterium]